MSLIKMMLVMVSVAAISKTFRSEERFSRNAETEIVCRLLLEKKKFLLEDEGVLRGQAQLTFIARWARPAPKGGWFGAERCIDVPSLSAVTVPWPGSHQATSHRAPA